MQVVFGISSFKNPRKMQINACWSQHTAYAHVHARYHLQTTFPSQGDNKPKVQRVLRKKCGLARPSLVVILAFVPRLSSLFDVRRLSRCSLPFSPHLAPPALVADPQVRLTLVQCLVPVLPEESSIMIMLRASSAIGSTFLHRLSSLAASDPVASSSVFLTETCSCFVFSTALGSTVTRNFPGHDNLLREQKENSESLPRRTSDAMNSVEVQCWVETRHLDCSSLTFRRQNSYVISRSKIPKYRSPLSPAAGLKAPFLHFFIFHAIVKGSSSVCMIDICTIYFSRPSAFMIKYTCFAMDYFQLSLSLSLFPPITFFSSFPPSIPSRPTTCPSSKSRPLPR